MSHLMPNEIPMPEGLEERDDDVHDLQFGYDDDVDEDDAEEDLPDSHEPVVGESDLIKEILVRQAEAIEKLATGIQDISQALQQIAVTLAPPKLPGLTPPPPPPPPPAEDFEYPQE